MSLPGPFYRARDYAGHALDEQAQVAGYADFEDFWRTCELGDESVDEVALLLDDMVGGAREHARQRTA